MRNSQEWKWIILSFFLVSKLRSNTQKRLSKYITNGTRKKYNNLSRRVKKCVKNSFAFKLPLIILFIHFFQLSLIHSNYELDTRTFRENVIEARGAERNEIKKETFQINKMIHQEFVSFIFCFIFLLKNFVRNYVWCWWNFKCQPVRLHHSLKLRIFQLSRSSFFKIQFFFNR